jgi:hypothetical protein
MIDGLMIGGGDDEEHAVEIGGSELALMPLQLAVSGHFRYFGEGDGSNDGHCSSSAKETLDFWGSDGARSNNEAAATSELEEDGKHFHRMHDPTFSASHIAATPSFLPESGVGGELQSPAAKCSLTSNGEERDILSIQTIEYEIVLNLFNSAKFSSEPLQSFGVLYK